LLNDPGIPVAASPRTALSTNVLKAYGQTMRTADSQYVDSAPKAPHWHMARALLHFMTPEPTQDPATRRWYLAASAFLAATGDFANLSTHLDAAQTLFPDEAMVAFDLGWRSEAHATSLLQNDKRALVEAAEQRLSGRKDVRRATVLCNLRYIPCDSRNNPFGIKSVRNSLTDAERFFTRAVTLDPRMSEAHVRLAYVRALLGRYAEAEAVLKNMPLAGDVEVTYYAAIVWGLTLDGLNRLDEAAAAYEQALTLFPYAQSANLAMSVVQRKRGDTFGSVELAKRAIAPELVAADPFKRYRYGRGRNVADAWAAVYASRAQ